jgi:8-oxo-dGTP diphosphatase
VTVPAAPHTIVRCAGAIVFDAGGRLLLIRRLREPGAGSWSLPGGRCEAGETTAAACIRELAEETGLVGRVRRPAGQVERDGPAGVSYLIDDFVCEPVGGQLRAGDDAGEARWVDRSELDALHDASLLVPQLRDTLAGWDLLPT